MMNVLRRLSILQQPLAGLATAVLLAAGAAQADIVSAGSAEQQLRDGAQALDVRPDGSGPMLPGALRLDAEDCLRWLQAGDVQALSRAVSAAGLDLSRDVLIYGEAGDTRAQALYQALGVVSTGRLSWLVGGIAEWQQTGRATAAATRPRLPVPQFLVVRSDAVGMARMAAASLRDPAEPHERLAAR